MTHPHTCSIPEGVKPARSGLLIMPISLIKDSLDWFSKHASVEHYPGELVEHFLNDHQKKHAFQRPGAQQNLSKET